VGPKEKSQWFAESWKKFWTIDIRGTLGPPGMKDVDHSIVILNRLVTWTNKGIQLEADPKTLVKKRIEEGQATMYRSASVRLANLSPDRPDLLVLGKELAEGLQKPTQAHFQMLKKGVRHFRSYSRLIHLFANQDKFKQLDVWVDADHAGCIRSRKSTTGTVLGPGKNAIKTPCKSKAVLSLSSYGLVSGFRQGLGEQSTLRDWGITIPMLGFIDAITGLAIVSKLGLES